MMQVVPSVEFFYTMEATFGDDRATTDLAHFLTEDVPDILKAFADWPAVEVVSRKDPYRRTVIDIRGGVPCSIDALLRTDGVVELERISFDWETWIQE